MHQRWVATAPGGPEVLVFEEYDVPPPGPGEVTIEVRAPGVNPADFPKPIGYEVAGVISAVGPDTGFSVGQEVVAYRVTGGWARR